MFSSTFKIKDCMRIRTLNRKTTDGLRGPLPTFSVCILGVLTLLSTGCRSGDRLPDPSSKAYADYVSTFYVGLAALQVGDDVRAESNLASAAQMVPGEPAGWANWGILALRQRSFDAAGQRLDRARELAPKNDRIYYLLGLLEGNRGNSAKAIADLRQAIQLNPANLRAIYQLATEMERQGDANSDADFQHLMEQILTAQPNNLAALLELSRIAAKRGDAATLHSTVDKIAAQSGAWPADVKQQLAALQTRRSKPGTKVSGHALDLSAQCFDAGAGVPREPFGDQAAAGRRGHTLYAFPAARHRPYLTCSCG